MVCLFCTHLSGQPWKASVAHECGVLGEKAHAAREESTRLSIAGRSHVFTAPSLTHCCSISSRLASPTLDDARNQIPFSYSLLVVILQTRSLSCWWHLDLALNGWDWNEVLYPYAGRSAHGFFHIALPALPCLSWACASAHIWGASSPSNPGHFRRDRLGAWVPVFRRAGTTRGSSKVRCL